MWHLYTTCKVTSRPWGKNVISPRWCYIYIRLCVYGFSAHESSFIMYRVHTLLLVHSLPLMPFLSLCLSLSPVFSVSNFLCVSVFLPLFPMCVSPCFLSSLLPSCHMFLHLSQFISLAHCLPSGSLQWLTAYKQRVFGYGLKATHNQAHSLSLTYKEDFTSHVGNLHTSICSLTLKFTYWM